MASYGCEHYGCPRIDTLTWTTRFDDREYELRLCRQHYDALRDELRGVWGIRTVREFSDTTDYKGRELYLAKSGTPFTAADARPWLVAQGLAKSGAGRLSQQQLDAYADTH